MGSIIEFVRQNPRSPTATDEAFGAIRNEIQEILQKYQNNQSDAELITRVWQLIIRLEEIEEEDTTGHTYERAATNIVVASSRIKRTHYAAYMAGKISMYESIGDKFKSWMHNAAANGAISLGDLLDDVLLRLQGREDKQEVSGFVKVFRNAAFEDAVCLLDRSICFDPSSPLTAYNRAKLYILSKQSELRQAGIEKIMEIDPPQRDCHPAELAWHENNYETFDRADTKMKNIIKTQDGDKFVLIKRTLERNQEIARDIIRKRGDIWVNQTVPNRGAIVITSVGILAAAVSPFVVPEGTEILKGILAHGVDSLLGLVDTSAGAQAATNVLGDGGLAAHGAEDGLSMAAADMIRATFGDGGLA